MISQPDASTGTSDDDRPRPRGAEAMAGGAGRAAGFWILAALMVGALAVTFLLPPQMTLGASHTDLIGQFVAWRAFAADSLRAGNFPLWNPFVYSGQPFLGGFQSALLYPPNLIFVLLPLERALTFSILAHLILLGSGVAYWATRRGVHVLPAAIAGFSLALSGVVFPHVYAGHLSNVCTMAWVPWAFAGLEAWFRERRVAGLLLASAAIAMQILAGQVQYVYFFGVAAGVHALVSMGFEPAVRRRALVGVAVVCATAAVLTAAQLLPGLEAAGEGVRQGRLDFGFAGSFALPPENLLTAVAPGFFGDTDIGAHPYWGRCYIWEMSLYFGLGAAFCALAACRVRDCARAAWADWTVAMLLLGLALGRHLPVYRWLYEYVPGFGQFRGMSKFTFPAVLFLTMASASGLDGLVRGRWNLRRIGWGVIAAGVVTGAAALLLALRPVLVRNVYAWVFARAPEELLGPGPAFPPGAEAHAAASLAWATAFCVMFGGSLLLTAKWPRWRWFAVALVPLEMVRFVLPQIATTSIVTAMPPELREFVVVHPGDYRVLDIARPNNGHLLGAPDLWGNDPGVLKRYAEFMTFTQGGDPNRATQNLPFATVHRLYAMLRCRYAFVPSETGVHVVDVPNPLPHVLVLSDYRVIAGRDAIFAALAADGFDPRRTVILEKPPSPGVPMPAAVGGTARVIASDSDSLTIEADVTAPALLLITDLHARGWTAEPLPGSAQTTYEIVPANYILRAVPLEAGHHRIKMEYRPRTLTLGLLVSAFAWIGWLGAILVGRRRARGPAQA